MKSLRHGVCSWILTGTPISPDLQGSPSTLTHSLGEGSASHEVTEDLPTSAQTMYTLLVLPEQLAPQCSPEPHLEGKS